jgi:ribonuclease HI
MFYAVVNGRTKGIFTNWEDCKKSVSGYQGAVHKKFKFKSQAEEFMDPNKKKNTKKIDDYFVLDDNDIEPTISNEKEDEKSNIDNKLYSSEKEEKKSNNNNHIISKQSNIIYVYTDGACIKNGKDNSEASIGIYFGDNDNRNISEKIDGKKTNNTAEIKAIIKVYDILKNEIEKGNKIIIGSDSTYAINCATKYRSGQKRKGGDIPNKELVQQIYNIYKQYPNVEFIHVKAHTDNKDKHSLGNEQADLLANKALGLDSCSYYKTYINVPFNRKDEVKKLGGMWNKKEKKWFIYENNPKKEYLISIFGITN